MNNQPAEQFWKAGVTIEMPIATYQLGLGYSDEQMHSIARILPQTPSRASRICFLMQGH